jgi:hypothetical protein
VNILIYCLKDAITPLTKDTVNILLYCFKDTITHLTKDIASFFLNNIKWNTQTIRRETHDN